MEKRISWNLKCCIDANIDDRKREPVHCHIKKNGLRVAQVWLEPYVRIDNMGLDRNELKEVEEFCEENRYELIREYKEGF